MNDLAPAVAILLLIALMTLCSGPAMPASAGLPAAVWCLLVPSGSGAERPPGAPVTDGSRLVADQRPLGTTNGDLESSPANEISGATAYVSSDKAQATDTMQQSASRPVANANLPAVLTRDLRTRRAQGIAPALAPRVS